MLAILYLQLKQNSLSILIEAFFRVMYVLKWEKNIQNTYGKRLLQVGLWGLKGRRGGWVA